MDDNNKENIDGNKKLDLNKDDLNSQTESRTYTVIDKDSKESEPSNSNGKRTYTVIDSKDDRKRPNNNNLIKCFGVGLVLLIIFSTAYGMGRSNRRMNDRMYYDDSWEHYDTRWENEIENRANEWAVEFENEIIDPRFEDIENNFYNERMYDGSDYPFYEDVDSVEIVVSSTDIILENNNGDSVGINFDPGNIDKYEYKVKNRTLYLTERKRVAFSDFDDDRLIISLPSGLSSGKIKTASGDIYIDSIDFIDGGLNLKTASGDIVIDYVNSDYLDIKTASGDIRTMNSVLNDMDISTASGKIEIENIDAGDIELETASGNIEGYAVYASTASAKTASGNVGFQFSNREGLYLDSKTVSGRINVILPRDTEAYEISKSVSGNIKSELIQNDNASVILESKTTSGNISYRYE